MGVLALFAGFLVLASLAGGNHARQMAKGLERSETEEVQRLTTLAQKLAKLETTQKPLSARDPRNAVWMGQEGAARLAVLPPAPLASVAMGQRDFRPQAVRVTSALNLILERETETPMAGPTRLQTGAFDPAFLFVVLFPLVIIALSYELLSGERERGTLAMLLSQPVSQGAFVLGKALARLTALSGLTLVFAFLGLLIAGGSFFQREESFHFLLYAGVLVGWATFWFATAILVNSRGGSSAKNALVLVGIWLVVVVVVPGLVNVGVDTFYPPPSRIELLHEAREAARDIQKELNNLEGRHDVDPKAGDGARKIIRVQDELVKRSEPVLKELNEKLQERQTILSALRFLSPAILVQLSLEDVAGSGSIRHARFEKQADSFHREFRAFFSERVQSGLEMRTKDLRQLPSFEFKEEPTKALAARTAVSVGALLLLSMLLGLGARPGLEKVGRLTG